MVLVAGETVGETVEVLLVLLSIGSRRAARAGLLRLSSRRRCCWCCWWPWRWRAPESFYCPPHSTTTTTTVRNEIPFVKICLKKKMITTNACNVTFIIITSNFNCRCRERDVLVQIFTNKPQQRTNKLSFGIGIATNFQKLVSSHLITFEDRTGDRDRGL